LGKGVGRMSTVVESTRGHYERKEEPCGESYVWCPECVVVECGCGVRVVLSPSRAVCRCGADHAALVAEESASHRMPHAALHPWRDEHRDWWEKQDDYLRSESHYWRELRAID
jgi:hypothetical protein